MSLFQIEHHPSSRQLRVFGLCCMVFLAGWGLALWAHHQTTAGHLAVVWGLAVGLPVLGWVFPPALRWLYVGMSYLTFPIGAVLSLLILGAIYYLIVTPVGLLLRCRGHDPLQRRFEPDAASYWVERTEPADPKRYFRTF